MLRRVHHDAVQQAAQQGLFGFGEVAEEFALHGADRRVDPLKGRRARLGDLHDVPAPVGRVAAPLGEPRRFRLVLAPGAMSQRELAAAAVPALGGAAAIGVALYFLGALITHLRAKDYEIAPVVIITLLAIAALVLRTASA
ncbi:DoxX family protein [Streptomyces venezuelae]|uniref:DoxX family protein n=1 Tax=Streptomyces venezuelae TaxID=54571 RepID=UPI00168D0022|nr:DoxX family protein [Streptomyces venezuelae]